MSRSHRSETWASGRIKASGYQVTVWWAIDHELGIGGRIGAGDRVDHKARQVGGGVLGGKLVGKLGSSKLPELELGLDLLFLLTTTRLGHPSFLPVPN